MPAETALWPSSSFLLQCLGAVRTIEARSPGATRTIETRKRSQPPLVLPSFAHGLESRIVLRRDEISFSQGAEWNALISKYIGTIPLSGDASCAVEQSISGGPPPRTPLSSAMIAKVGAAARHSQSTAPSAAALPLS